MYVRLPITPPIGDVSQQIIHFWNRDVNADVVNYFRALYDNFEKKLICYQMLKILADFDLFPIFERTAFNICMRYPGPPHMVLHIF